MDDSNSHSIRTFCKLIAKVEKIFATFKFHFVLLSQHQFAKKNQQIIKNVVLGRAVLTVVHCLSSANRLRPGNMTIVRYVHMC